MAFAIDFDANADALVDFWLTVTKPCD